MGSKGGAVGRAGHRLAMALAAKKGGRNMARAARRAGTIDLGAMANVTGYRLRLAQLAVFKEVTRRLKTYGMRPADFAVMRLIETNPGSKQSDIAAALGIKRANFVVMMNRLEERGLAERRRQDSDRRSHALYLTAQGEKAMADMNVIHNRHEADIAARLGGEDARRELVRMLEVLSAD